MKKIRVEEAVGLKLCHDITKVVPGEFKGAAFKRDHVIQIEDVEELLKLGKEHIYVWEDNANEVHEDDAAIRLAKAVMGEHLSYTETQEGKSSLVAMEKGLLKVNSPLMLQINSVEDVTIPSLPNNYKVEVDQKVAATRIVPLVTKEENIRQVEALCAQYGPAFHIEPYRKLKVGVVITGSEVFKGRIKDKFGPVIQKKMEYFQAQILGQEYCMDELAYIEQKIRDFKTQGADLIIVTGGMSVDPDDLTPGAIRNASTEVVAYGVPVQPGNMFMLAYIDDTAVMGVPGAASYFKTTVLDIVLPRIFIGERLQKMDFIQMAEGGLCSHCPMCQYPNCYFGR